MADGCLLCCETWAEAEGGWARGSSCCHGRAVTEGPAKPPRRTRCRWGRPLRGNSKGTAGHGPSARFSAGGAALAWDFLLPARYAGAHLPFFFSVPPTKPVCPAVLPAGEAGELPMLEHSLSHLPPPSGFTMLVSVPVGIGTQPSPGVLPTPNLAAVARGMEVRGLGGRGSHPVPGWLGAAGRHCQRRGKSNRKPAELSLFIQECQGQAGERWLFINTQGVNSRQGDELFNLKDNAGTRTKGIN